MVRKLKPVTPGEFLSNGYWLRAQAAHDTEVAEPGLSSTLTAIKPWSVHSDARSRTASRE